VLHIWSALEIEDVVDQHGRMNDLLNGQIHELLMQTIVDQLLAQACVY
jgi:hypothetical protein